MNLAAGAYRYRPLRKRDPFLGGWDVWALQQALADLGYSVVPDGVFGPQTERGVRAFQQGYGLETDGIAGPASQREVILQIVWPVQKAHDTPPGLMRGIIEGESAFLVGNHTPPYANGTRDIGVTMRNLPPTEANLRKGFDISESVQLLGGQLRTRKNASLRGDDHERAWKYGAVLYWNWPAASAAYVQGIEDTWSYLSGDRRYKLDNEAPWVIALGVSGVRTGRQWISHYVDSKTRYVPEKEWNR